MSININPNLNQISFSSKGKPAEPEKPKKLPEIKIVSRPDAFDKKLDAIETSTEMKPTAKTTDSKGLVAEKKLESEPETPIQTPIQTQPQSIAEAPIKNTAGNVAGQVYSKISKTSAIAKGFIDGTITGLVAGTAAAGFDMIISGTKRIKNKEIKFYQIFNPKKALSKSGKSLSIAIALGFLIGQIAIPIFKSKKQTGK